MHALYLANLNILRCLLYFASYYILLLTIFCCLIYSVTCYTVLAVSSLLLLCLRYSSLSYSLAELINSAIIAGLGCDFLLLLRFAV